MITIKVEECGGVWMARAYADGHCLVSVAASSEAEAVAKCRAYFPHTARRVVKL